MPAHGERQVADHYAKLPLFIRGPDVLPLLLSLLALVALLVPLWFYASADISRQKLTNVTAAISMGQLCSTVQLLGTFSELDISWTDPIRSILRFMDVFVFDGRVS